MKFNQSLSLLVEMISLVEDVTPHSSITQLQREKMGRQEFQSINTPFESSSRNWTGGFGKKLHSLKNWSNLAKNEIMKQYKRTTFQFFLDSEMIFIQLAR